MVPNRKRHRKRRQGARKKTVALKRISRQVLRSFDFEIDDMGPPLELARPRVRSECADVPRPCPFVSCRYNAYLEINPISGNITFVYPDREPHQMPADASCVLDVADRGGMTLEEVGGVTNLTRERIRQIEVKNYFLLRAELKKIGVTHGVAAGGATNEPAQDTDINMELAF